MCRDFQSLLSESEDWRQSIRGINFEVMENDDPRRLEEPFSKEGFFATFSYLSGEKAPRPYGSTMVFWHSCWDLVKLKVTRFFMDFFYRGTFKEA